MDKFKKFFKNKKIEKHFKNSGPGVRLSDGQSSSSQPSIRSGSAQGGQVDRIAAADIAAQAAMKRMQKNETPKTRKIEMLVKRQMEEEEKERKLEEEMGRMNMSRTSEVEPEELEHSSAISKVLFTSELLGDDHMATKPELLRDIQNYLSEQAKICEEDENKAIAAVLMIYSLNKTDQKNTAIQTITKICENILQNPDEPKFKSIRVNNKNIQEKILSVVGGRDFLEAVGFEEKSEGGETMLVFARSSDCHLIEALETLKNGQAVPIKVARNLELKTLVKGEKIQVPQLSKDFYNLTPSEIKEEQRTKTAQVERMMTLRTKEMRIKDEQVSNNRYKYTLIRVRLPNDVLMQGVFGCYESFSAVRQFVSSVLDPSLAICEFSLRDIGGQNVDDESVTLAALGLAPAAVLHLTFAQNPSESAQLIAEEHLHLLAEQE